MELSRVWLSSAEMQGEFRVCSTDPVVICCELFQSSQFGEEISGTVIYMRGNDLCTITARQFGIIQKLWSQNLIWILGFIT